ncbi:MAG: hypothetical protein JST60_09880 [Chloroflexi bacterium SZAS-1]|nr:hypothetical protein [Chloroflexi bacterium SZAS-1]
MNDRRRKRYWSKLGTGVYIALLFLASFGTYAVVRAQTAQTCRTVNNLKICGDTLTFDDGTSFSLRGNIKIGPASPSNAAPLVHFTDAADTFKGKTIDDSTKRAGYFHRNPADANNGTTDFIIGVGRFIDDANTTPLMGSGYVDNPVQSGQVLIGRFFVDTVNQKIFIPPDGAVPVYEQAGITRNSNVLFPFMNRAQLNQFYSPDSQVGDFELIDAAFDLKNKKFTASMPLKLKMTDNDENANLRITVQANFSNTGQFSGSVTGFKMKLAGLVLESKNITLNVGSFTAGQVDVLKIDNPDLPSLDPTNNTVIFSFTNLKYQDGKFSIGGVSVPIKEWVFGEAFKMTAQTLSLSNDATTKTAVFTIKSTLKFGSAADNTTQIPVTATIGRAIVNGQPKPILAAGLQDVTPTVGIFKMNLKGVQLTSDPAQDFFGIVANTAELQWPANLGGQKAAGVSGFKLGISKAKALKFALANGSVGTPEFQSSVLKGTFSGSVGVQNEVVTWTLTGNLTVTVPGNSAIGTTANLIVRSGKDVKVSCVNQPAPCFKKYDQTLSAFNLKLAGFGLGLQNVSGQEDGGFTAASASLTLPNGLGSVGATVSGLKVDGTGNVSVTGGSIEIPPIQIAGTNFVGLKGTFAKDPSSGYKFGGGATLSLPGLDPSGGFAVSANVTIATKVDGSFKQLDVVVSFSVTAPGIPIGSTGMALTGMSGSFSLQQQTANISFGVTVGSIARIGPLPIVSLTGTASTQINPFKMSLGVTVRLLVFNVGSALTEVGAGAGFNGGNGFHFHGEINAVLFHGGIDVRAGQVTVNGVKKTAFVGSINASISINNPITINIASASLTVGNFKNTDDNTVTFGVKGQVRLGSDGNGPEVTVFFDLKKTPGSGDFFIFGPNAKDFVQLGSNSIDQAISDGLPGYSRRAIAAHEAGALGLAANPDATIQEVAVPLTANETRATWVGLHFGSGNPTVRLKLPNGTIITEATANGSNQEFIRQASADGTAKDLAFLLKPATPGSYQLLIDNPPASYNVVFFQLDTAPTISGVTANRSGNTVAVNWSAADDTPGTVVSVGYAPLAEGSAEPDFTRIYTLTENLALGSQAYNWNLNEVPTGAYKVVVTADDGKNTPKRAAASTLINVVDTTPPAVPTGLGHSPLPGQLLVTWNPNTEQDIAGYEIGFGLSNNPNAFLYTRDMGAKEVQAGGKLDARLWGLQDNQVVFYGIRAYDISGNKSNWSPLVSAAPWDLSPRAWTPAPGSKGTGTVIEAAFITELQSFTAQQAASLMLVRNATGATIPGTVTGIFADDGRLVGLRFTPIGSLPAGDYTATLKGGSNGVKAADGRQMPQDYSWKFTVELSRVFVPLARKP